MGGGLAGGGVCNRRLRGAARSQRTLFCQPSAIDQQSASQPCTDLIPPSLSLSLPLSRSPSLPEALTVPVSPSYANCLSRYQRCMSVWQPLCPLLCMPVSPSTIPPVLLSVCCCVCVPACPSACLPASHFSWPIPLCRKAARLLAALPICPTICLSIHHLFVSSLVCLPVCLNVYLPACPSVSYLFICLSASTPRCFVKWRT